MSDMGNIVSAVTTAASTAVSAAATSTEVVSLEQLRAEQIPFVMVLDGEYRSEPLEYRQIRRRYAVRGIVVQEGSTRAAMITKLEAIRAAIEADTSLGSLVDYALFTVEGIQSSPDSSRVYGIFGVEAEKVA